MPREHRPRPPQGTVARLTHSLFFRLLTLVVTLLAAAQCFRMWQRLQWLLLDFRPNGTPLERIFMTVHEGLIFAGGLLTVLLAGGCIMMLKPSGAGIRLTRFTLGLYAACSLLGALAVLGVGGFVVYACVHYRLSIQVLGYSAIITLAASVMLMILWRYFHNLRRILKELRRAHRRSGKLMHGEGVRCHLPSQAWLVTIAALAPVITVVSGGVVTAWIINVLLKPVIGAVAADQLNRVLAGGWTSPAAMYSVETITSAMSGLAMAMTALLYRPYMKSHGQEPPRSWQPQTHGSTWQDPDKRRFRHWDD